MNSRTVRFEDIPIDEYTLTPDPDPDAVQPPAVPAEQPNTATPVETAEQAGEPLELSDYLGGEA